MIRALIIASFFVASAAVAQDEADPLAAGDAAWAEANLARAVDEYEGALRTGGLSGEVLVRALRMVGILRSIAGEPDAAERAFTRSLALDPTQGSPTELSPELLVAFERARSANEGALRFGVSAAEGAELNVELSRVPEGWVETLDLRASPPGAAPWEESYDGSPRTLQVPAAAWRGAQRLVVELIARDSFGNVLARAETELVRHTDAPLEVPLEEEDGRSVAASPWLWVGIGAVIVGGVVTAVLLTRSTEYSLNEPVFNP